MKVKLKDLKLGDKIKVKFRKPYHEKPTWNKAVFIATDGDTVNFRSPHAIDTYLSISSSLFKFRMRKNKKQ